MLQIADFIGGDWPQRARQALVNAFALAAFEDFYSSKQILSDIRDAFSEKDNPEWISSTDLLSFLHTMDNRTWDTWTKDKPMQPKALARLLEPFGIGPRNHRTGPKTIPKGYYREDLEPIWQRHLPEPGTTCGEGVISHATISVAAKLQNSAPAAPKLAASSQEPGANPVAADLQDFIPSQSKPAAALRCQPKEAGSQKPLATPLRRLDFVRMDPPQESSQKLAATPRKHFAGNMKTPSIGARIMSLFRNEDQQTPNS